MQLSEFHGKRTWGPSPKYPNVMNYVPPDNRFKVISGPCSVESVAQIFEIASIIAAYGVTHLRGGVYRAGTYPGENFGLLPSHILSAFHEAANSNELVNIIEVLDVRLIDRLSEYADCFQVGCRQMQNYPLLRALGKTGKPIFLKRGTGSTLDEFLGAAEHLLVGGAKDVTLIERGSSTYHNHVRWDLSISMIPAVQLITKMPIVCDASHGTGRRDLVRPMALAGAAAGANGVLIEVHTDPVNSLSDADQAIKPVDLFGIVDDIKRIRSVL